MAIQVSLTPDGIGVLFESSGVLTAQDLIGAHERLHVETRHNPGIRYLLVDHSAAPQEQIDSATLEELAQRASDVLEVVQEGIVAIVAPNDVLFGLSRMWESYVERTDLTTRVMRTRTEAAEWLREVLTGRGLPFRLDH